MSRPRSRKQKREQVRSGYVSGMRPGSVMRARRASNKLHVTIHVDGDHQGSYSLAGIGLDLENLERLIKRLQNLRDSIVRDSKDK